MSRRLLLFGFAALALLLSLATSCAAQVMPPLAARPLSSMARQMAAPGGVRQITGHRPDLPYLVADPAVMPQPDGSVWVAGTGDILVWPSLEAMMRGEPAKKLVLNLYQRVGGRTVRLNPDELPWDLQFYERGGRRILLGGVMSPRPGTEHARWPDDNISRRIKIAEYDESLPGWVFREEAFFGTPDHQSFLGHAYGHQLYSENGQDYVFHEEVSYEADTATGQPRVGTGHFATELFVRRVGPQGPGEKIKVLGVKDLPLASTQRVIGGFLLEGPRVARYLVQGKPVHVVFYSTGDYPTKNYTVMAAYSTSGPLGPYQSIDDTGNQPLNLTAKMQDSVGLYGVGRAFPFTYQDKPWIIFHGARDIPGVDHSQWPKAEPIRHLYVAPLEMGFAPDGRFWIRL
ncbi:MAG: hypothetical protein CVV27_18560, partial [Candidatus Melainabacteria bacterium HGW-Melainabacteria-1]